MNDLAKEFYVRLATSALLEAKKLGTDEETFKAHLNELAEVSIETAEVFGLAYGRKYPNT